MPSRNNLTIPLEFNIKANDDTYRFLYNQGYAAANAFFTGQIHYEKMDIMSPPSNLLRLFMYSAKLQRNQEKTHTFVGLFLIP